ncbi:MAG: hypothetical protein ACYSTY_07940 [Planctomycetota bacterium]|jgi:uncharacterized protein involved in outer membrane biogenesis
MKRQILRIAGVLLVLLIAAVVTVVLYLDAIAKGAIEAGATYALGVQTTLQDADVRLLLGRLSIAGLDVENPEGFERDHFLRLDQGRVAVQLGSLRQETVDLPHLRLNGVDLNLERRNDKANYNVILGNLKKVESAREEPADKPAEKKPGKKFVIEEVTVTDIHVGVDLLPFGGELTRLDVPIDEIRLQNVGSGGGVPMDQLTGIVIKAIFAALMSEAGSLPADLVKDLGNALAGLEQLGDLGISLATGSGDLITGIGAGTVDTVGGVGEGVLEGVGGAVEEVGKGVGEALEGLGGLLTPKEKNDDEKEKDDDENPK